MRLEAASAVDPVLAVARAAQRDWAAQSLQQRLQILRKLRHEIAADPAALAETVPTRMPGALHRTVAATLVAEVLPLLEACRFLEREAAFILAPRHESAGSRPIWLRGVSVESRREPFGVVLILGPANYPLFLPGVQVLQALAAGNAVLWKPAPGVDGCASALRRVGIACGLNPGLLTVLDTDPKAATALMRAGPGLAPDKVILTGSATTGRAVLRELAQTLTPATMELSGCDAVFVLEGADLGRVVDAIAFALRVNGSATCMAPRRLFVADAVANQLVPRLTAALESDPFTLHARSAAQVRPKDGPEDGPGDAPGEKSGERSRELPAEVLLLPQHTRLLLSDLVSEATLYGAKLLLPGAGGSPTLVDRVTPEMRIAKADIFAPVLSILRVPDTEAALAAHRACPYVLTAAVFGPPREAEALATRIHAGTVLINDLIVPTADPRAAFAGRGESGFGSTRGREGLLAMTQPKAVLRQRSRSRRAYQPTGPAHLPFFAGLAQMLHARPWRTRLAGLRQLIAAGKQIK